MIPPKVTPTKYAEEKLREMVEADAGDWESRKTLSRLLYDRDDTVEAAELLWAAPEIPSVDFELAFAARILAKGTPRRAIRLLNALLDQNRGKPVQNLGIANALLHHGMVMQAARFYGAAIEGDSENLLRSADLEHFLLWIDDREKLWGDFEGIKDELDELPWMNRDAEQADVLRMSMAGHTTPVQVTSLPPIPAEEVVHQMYKQEPKIGAEPSPPPAVTIPMDRVAAKDRLFDEKLGAAEPGTGKAADASAGELEPLPDETPISFENAQPLPFMKPAPAPAPPTPKPTARRN